LSPRDLEGLADAAWWLSRWDESIAARQHAFTSYAAAGDDPQAAFNAVLLCFDHVERGDPAVAMGWLMRAQRHLDDLEACVQHGFLALPAEGLLGRRQCGGCLWSTAETARIGESGHRQVR